MIAKRCSTKKLSYKFLRIHQEIPVRQSLSNTLSLPAVMFATLLKKDPVTGVSELAISRSSGKQVFLNNLQNSQESTCVPVPFK